MDPRGTYFRRGNDLYSRQTRKYLDDRGCFKYKSVDYPKEHGMVTSIVTNGSRITEQFLGEVNGHLDWIGLSIDNSEKLIWAINPW